jgi:hypothetical protein
MASLPSAPIPAHWPFQGTKLDSLLLPPISLLWFSERVNGNWWLGFQIPFCFYTILHFCKPLTLLAACFMLVSYLAYSISVVYCVCVNATTYSYTTLFKTLFHQCWFIEINCDHHMTCKKRKKKDIKETKTQCIHCLRPLFWNLYSYIVPVY